MLRYALFTLMLIFACGTSKADISASMCQSYMAVISQAVNLRENSVPIATARSMADSALSLNPQLWRFLLKAVNTTYSEPERIKTMRVMAVWLRCALKR